MRIGMFTNCYPPSWGGLELSVTNLCKGLENAGHKVFVFAPQYPNLKDKEKNYLLKQKLIRANFP